MAYISKEQIQEKRKQINALCKLHGVSATVSGSNTSSVTVTIRKGTIDFLGNHVQTVKALSYVDDRTESLAIIRQNQGHFNCNHYYLDRQFSGVALTFLEQLLVILKIGHYDNSDAMVDYFDTTYYMHICIGTYEKPYLLIIE